MAATERLNGIDMFLTELFDEVLSAGRRVDSEEAFLQEEREEIIARMNSEFGYALSRTQKAEFAAMIQEENAKDHAYLTLHYEEADFDPVGRMRATRTKLRDALTAMVTMGTGQRSE